MQSKLFACPPVLIGHRGTGRGRSAAGHRENTPEGFAAAAAAGAAWVEMDVRRAADDVLVVLHDHVLLDGRSADGLTSDELRQHGVHALDSILGQLPDGLGVDLDVKARLDDALRPADRTTGAMVARVAARIARTRPVLVTAFSPPVLLQSRAIAPEVPVGLLTPPGVPLREAVPAAKHLGAVVAAPYVSAFGLPGELAEGDEVTPEVLGRQVRVARAAGVELLVWGLGHHQLRSVVARGADAVCIDEIVLVPVECPPVSGGRRRRRRRAGRARTGGAVPPSHRPR